MEERERGKVPQPDSDLVEAGLLAAFQRGPAPGESVLDAFERRGALRPSIRLREDARLDQGDSETRSHTHYTFSDEIGRGGVGVVIRGTDLDLGRDVALKVLREDYVDHPQVLARFIEEAQIEGQLQHPGIIPVYELGMSTDGRPFFAMKLVEGKTLAELLAERSTPHEGRRRLLGAFEQICQAMAYAHARGVLHRDLKPSNVMVGSFGEVQVVDWGLAKVLGRTEEDVIADDAVRTVRTEKGQAETRVGSAMGTPSYMAPEQALGRVAEVDERSDVFALGAILLEILTGAPPYPAAAPDVLAQAALAKLDDARERLAACDAEADLKALCAACLTRDREQRPRDAKAVTDAVVAHLQGVEERARQAELTAAEERAKAQAERKARRLTVALAGTVVLAGLLLGGGYLWRQAEAQERQDLSGRSVAGALGEARTRLGEARRAAVGDLEAWRAARDAARRASEVARTGGARPAVVQTALDTLDEIERDYQAAETASRRKALDDRTATRLEEIRGRRGDLFEFLKVESDYADAFREHGIDLEALDPEDAAARVGASGIASELCAALDDWALVRRRYDDRQAEQAASLQRIANAADPDAQRVRVRQVAAGFDLDQVRALRDEIDAPALGPAGELLLARTLATVDSPRAGITLLQSAAVSHPDDFWTHYQLGTWLLQEKPSRADEALGHLLAACGLRPDSPDARLYLGHALRSLERWDDAVAAYEEVLALRPDDARPYVYLVSCASGMGEVEAYLQGLVAEAEGAPDDPVLEYRIGRCHAELEQWDAAIEHYQGAIRLAPEFVLPYASLAVVYEKLPDRAWGRAEQSMQRATELEPWNWLWWRLLGNYRGNQGKYVLAREAFEQALRCAPDRSVNHRNVVQVRANLDDVPGAVEAYAELLRRFKDDPDLGSVEYVLAMRSGSTHGPTFAREMARRAIDHLERDFESSPRNARRFRSMIATLKCDVLYEFEEAAEIFDGIRFGPRQDRRPWHNLSIAKENLGLYDEVIALMRRLLAETPDDPAAHERLASQLFLTGDLASAVEHEAIASQAYPDDPMVQADFGFMNAALGRYEEAREALRRYHASAPWPESRRPTEAEWSRISETFLRCARDMAGFDMSRAEELDAQQLVDLAFAYHEIVRPREALLLFERAFETDPSLRFALSPWWRTYPYVALAGQAAALAASGLGGYEEPLTEAEAAHARALALGWLGESYVYWEEIAQTQAWNEPPEEFLTVVTIPRKHGSYAVIREDRHLQRLSPEEQERCRALWAEVDRVVQVVERYLPHHPAADD